MELEYAELAEGYDIRKSISELIDMYKLAISINNSGPRIQTTGGNAGWSR